MVNVAETFTIKNIEECKNYKCWLIFVYQPHLFPEHLFPTHLFPKHLFPKHLLPEHLFPKHLFPEHLFPEHLFPRHLFPKLMEISILESDWLAPHHHILNAKFSPITAFLNRSTYHKSAKVSLSPCPQVLWAPQINE